MSETDEGQFEVEFLNSPRDGEIVPINASEAIVGRDGDTELSVAADTQLAGKHLKICCRDNEISIEALGDGSATFVNDESLQGVRVISETDVVRTGGTEFVCRVLSQLDEQSMSAESQVKFQSSPSA